MDIQALTPKLSVAGQILASDIPSIAKAGFQSIICNRPDGEGADQPGFGEIAQAAQQAGLQVRYLPVESGNVTQAHGTDFGKLMDELPKPVLAYCRSGMRSTTLWGLSIAAAVDQPEA